MKLWISSNYNPTESMYSATLSITREEGSVFSGVFACEDVSGRGLTRIGFSSWLDSHYHPLFGGHHNSHVRVFKRKGDSTS